MMFDAQTIEPASSSASAELVSFPPVDQMRRQQGRRPQGAQDQHGDQPDRRASGAGPCAGRSSPDRRR